MPLSLARRLPLTATVAIVALTLGMLPAPAADEMEQGTSSIVGKVTKDPGKTPVTGATVLAYHLSSAQVYRSEPTSSSGRYALAGMLPGYYDMAVQTADRLSVSNQVINALPDSEVVANFHLVPTSATGEEVRDFPGADRPPSGIAQFIKKQGMGKTGKALLIGGGIATLVAVGGGGDGGARSPSMPAP